MQNELLKIYKLLVSADATLNSAIEEYNQAYKALLELPAHVFKGDLQPQFISGAAVAMCKAELIIYYEKKRVAELLKQSETQTNQFDK